MSIISEITRLQEAKQAIKSTLLSLGCPITDNMTLDDYNVTLQYIDGQYKPPLTIIAKESAITVSIVGNNITKTISASTDNGKTWNSYTSTSSPGTQIASLQPGQKVLIKGNNSQYATDSNSYTYFHTSGHFDVEGNIMSLINGDDFREQYILPSAYTLYSIFKETNVVDASRLILPATTLTNYCYQSMFQGCTSLTTAPELPATTLAETCYYFMFQGCTSLTTAPELPATTLEFGCYSNMFNGCVSLTNAPTLPATTLTNYCYQSMFYGCTSLTTAPELPATTLTYCCYQYMFYGCTSLTTAPELPATTLANSCYHYMFQGCTSLTTAPELPATTLVENCYGGMFYYCTYLNYIKCSATNISASNCTTDWVINVAASGTFVKDPSMNSWPTGTSGIPSGWTVEDDYSAQYLTIKSTSNSNTIGWRASNALLTKTISVSTDNGSTWTDVTSTTGGATLATLNNGDKLLIKGSNTAYATSSSYYNYFTSTGNFDVEGNIMSLIYGDNFIGQTTLSENYTFHRLFSKSNVVDTSNLALPATTLTNYCYYNMFQGCTGLTTAPTLPATTLASTCYQNMFAGCTSLTTAPTLPATTLASSCYQNMFAGCTSLTTAPELPATTLASSCYQNMFYSCTNLTTAPTLPATTLANNCYNGMFSGCTSLNQITCLATDISASNCTYNWVKAVAASGTFVKAPYMTSWATGINGIPSGWTVVDSGK